MNALPLEHAFAIPCLEATTSPSVGVSAAQYTRLSAGKHRFTRADTKRRPSPAQASSLCGHTTGRTRKTRHLSKYTSVRLGRCPAPAPLHCAADVTRSMAVKVTPSIFLCRYSFLKAAMRSDAEDGVSARELLR